MLNVCEFEHRGIFGDVHVGAVRCQGLGYRAHGIGVLGEVLVAGEQSLGQAVVLFGVSSAAHRPGKDATGDEVAGAANQKFWRRTDEVRDVERPARRVVTGEVVQNDAHVEFAVDFGDDIAGENNLVQFSSVDALDSAPHGFLPLRCAQGAFTPVHGGVAPAGGGVDACRFHGLRLDPRGVDSRHPGLISPLADERRRNDHFRWVVGIERERCEGQGSGAGKADGVIDRHRVAQLGPPALGPGEALYSANLQARSAAPTDKAFPSTNPADVVSGGKSGQEIVGCLQGACGRHQQRGRVKMRMPRHLSRVGAQIMVVLWEHSVMTRARLDKQPREVAAMFDEVAQRYDRTNDVLALGQTRRWRKAVADAVGALPGDRVLDLAAGTGTSSEPIAAAGPFVVACDFSFGMLSVGRDRNPRLSFVAGDALSLPFADDAFDAVTISFGLRNVHDRDAGLRELLRVTRPGGRLVVCEFSHPTWAPFRRVYSEYLMGAVPAVASRASSNPDAYVYLAESIQSWPDQQELGQDLLAAGWHKAAWRNLSGGIVALHRAVKADV